MLQSNIETVSKARTEIETIKKKIYTFKNGLHFHLNEEGISLLDELIENIDLIDTFLYEFKSEMRKASETITKLINKNIY